RRAGVPLWLAAAENGVVAGPPCRRSHADRPQVVRLAAAGRDAGVVLAAVAGPFAFGAPAPAVALQAVLPPLVSVGVPCGVLPVRGGAPVQLQPASHAAVADAAAGAAAVAHGIGAGLVAHEARHRGVHAVA